MNFHAKAKSKQFEWQAKMEKKTIEIQVNGHET